MRLVRAILIWAALAAAICAPIAFAAASPLHEWRGPVYIIAGFAGILALALVCLQPLLIGGYLPGLSGYRGRRAHHLIGRVLAFAVAIHVGGLWISSPPDMIDALLFASPTPFSLWGVIAMWAIVAATILAALRQKAGLSPRAWRLAHMILAIIIVGGGVVHSLLIEGTMETMSKAVLCALTFVAAVKVMIDRRVWRRRATYRGGNLPQS
jgi:hypothetical protein